MNSNIKSFANLTTIIRLRISLKLQSVTDVKNKQICFLFTYEASRNSDKTRYFLIVFSVDKLFSSKHLSKTSYIR